MSKSPLTWLKSVLSRCKPFIRWFVLGAIVFFLAQTLKDRAAEVASLQISRSGWLKLAIALGVTALAHLWSGWVWLWILRQFDSPPASLGDRHVPLGRGLYIYLTTNVAKYLPGNVWHFYGRIKAIAESGTPFSVAALSVLLEPLLMAAAALAIAIFSSLNLANGDLSPTSPAFFDPLRFLKLLALFAVLVGVHPRLLNPVIQFLGKLKLKRQPPLSTSDPTTEVPNAPTAAQLTRYPLSPFLGEIGFLLLRGSGFILTVDVMTSVQWSAIPTLMSGFSIAWLLGLVVPGAPGGIGIFEATAIALLSHQFSPAAILGAVAFYRLISILAECATAAIAWGLGKR
ncbi:flippase-like domain-containing protein [Oxynema sp. CENA135]|uniref:lysylphosphatidylglycerol synthase domain-containing protein n=1 Tax=Oxynema sp. CENA135 TaxID=984206 RepID=UPI00190AAE44|nr:lysylphosphatidylglycerol synthase domain-containing protein [Oxynema sp. CENA135]MBK4730901.1 flippase-like domain-containing protein [Oxynema sp. CENA135]